MFFSPLQNLKPHVSRVTALFLLCQVYLILTHAPLVRMLAWIVLSGGEDVFSEKGAARIALHSQSIKVSVRDNPPPPPPSSLPRARVRATTITTTTTTPSSVVSRGPRRIISESWYLTLLKTWSGRRLKWPSAPCGCKKNLLKCNTEEKVWLRFISLLPSSFLSWQSSHTVTWELFKGLPRRVRVRNSRCLTVRYRLGRRQ